MAFNIDKIVNYYNSLPSKIKIIKDKLNRPLSLTEKILYSHLSDKLSIYSPSKDYVNFNIDRVAMQDATAQMALLQFIITGKNSVAVPTTVHADHLIQAKVGASNDLVDALDTNSEV